MTTTIETPRLTKLNRICTGTIFRFPGEALYYMKANMEAPGDSIKAVCLTTAGESGCILCFRGDMEAIVGPMGLPTDCLLPLGF